MILEDTPYSEIFKTINREREKVRYFEERESERVRKLDKKRLANKIYTSFYTIPSSRNTYLFYACIGGPTTLLNRKADQTLIQYGSCLLVNTNSGSRMVYGILENNNRQYKLVAHTAHFFKRYRERLNYPETMKTEEIIANYFSRNTNLAELDFEKMNINSSKYKDGIAVEMNEGVAFGNVTTVSDHQGRPLEVIRMNTFVSHKKLFKEQKETLYTKRAMRKQNIQEVIKKMLANDPGFTADIFYGIEPFIKK